MSVYFFFFVIEKNFTSLTVFDQTLQDLQTKSNDLKKRVRAFKLNLNHISILKSHNSPAHT